MSQPRPLLRPTDIVAGGNVRFAMADLVPCCPGCGAAVDGDPSACQSCGAPLAKVLLPMRQESTIGEDRTAQPFPSEPRQRKSGGQRLATVAGAVLLVVATAVVSRLWPTRRASMNPTSPTTPSVPALTVPRSVPASAVTMPAITSHPNTPTTLDILPGRPTGLVVVLTGSDGRITVIDPDHNRISQAPPPGGPLNQPRYPGELDPVAITGGRLVVEGSNGTEVWSEPPTLTGPVTDLGLGVLFWVDPAHPGRVWIVDASRGTAALRQVDLNGRILVDARSLPADWAPLAMTTAGVVLTRADRFEVWDPTTNTVRFSGHPGASPLAAAGHHLLWTYGCNYPFCPTHVTDLRTGADRVLPLQGLPGLPNFFNDRPLSSDGRYLVLDNRNTPALGSLLLFDLDTFTYTILDAGPTAYNGPLSLAWSATGRWLIAASNANVAAFQVGDPNGFRQLNLPVGLLTATTVQAAGP
jgi:hypothetical protein